MAGRGGLSAFELERAEKVKRNNERLKALVTAKLVAPPPAAAPAAAPAASRRAPAPAAPPPPPRNSDRLAGRPTVKYSDGDDAGDRPARARGPPRESYAAVTEAELDAMTDAQRAAVRRRLRRRRAQPWLAAQT